MNYHPTLRTLAFACLATVGLAACSDAPTGAAPATEAAARPHLTLATSAVTVAALNPAVDNIFQSSEGHRLVIPANSICKVGVSGYGPSYWDAACAPQTQPITFTIRSTVDANGHPRLDISPDVRFSPSKVVYAAFRDFAAANSFGSLIAYCPTGTSKCIDESLTDPSLATTRNSATGLVTRRIKHFSGYHVILGRDCEDASACEGGEGDGYGGARALPNAFGSSGYITTTGRGSESRTELGSSDR